MQKLTFYRDKNWVSLDENKNAVFNIPGMAEDWAMGTAAGIIMSAPGMVFGMRSNANAPISVKPFNAYQFETEGAYDKPISANTFPAMAQEKNTNKSSVLNLNNGNDNIININMQFFAEKDLKTQKSESLKRGIRKLESKIELHKSKLNNPQEYDKGWEAKPEREKAGLKKHWQKEIDNFEKSIENRIEELKKRGDYND